MLLNNLDAINVILDLISRPNTQNGTVFRALIVRSNDPNKVAINTLGIFTLFDIPLAGLP
tara:strand:+ start:72 stop:251 length:180 start_codon:yes stop_codon:yes gene_type:complete